MAARRDLLSTGSAPRPDRVNRIGAPRPGAGGLLPARERDVIEAPGARGLDCRCGASSLILAPRRADYLVDFVSRRSSGREQWTERLNHAASGESIPRAALAALGAMPERDSTESATVESLIADLEERVLTAARRVLTWAALPALVAYHAFEWFRGKPTIWIAADVVAAGVAVATLWSSASRKTRIWVLLAQLLVLCGVALLHFGPTMGTGLFYLCATLAAAFLLKERGTVLVVVGLTVLVVAAAVGPHFGLAPPATFSPQPTEWPRIATSSIVAITACALLFILVERSLHASLSAEISARRRERDAQLERERVLVAAEKNQRLEALGRLAGGVAHDFNNALTVIRGGIELLKMTSDDDTREELLVEIAEGVERATATARQLLAFARRGPDEAATTNPAERIEQVARSVARLLPANVSIETKATITPAIALSPGAFDQIVLNLVLNARDAMREGGTIIVTSREESGMAVVEVEDSGEGISPEVRARLFEPFFTTKGEHGTGLGLAMVWGLVSRAKGTIEVDSTPGKGSRFRLQFPPTERAEARKSDRAPRKYSGRALILDDEPDVRRVIVRMLQRTGLEVDPVGDVAEALSHIATGTYRLLVTDGIVTDGSVAAVIEKFRGKNPGAPIIVCSGHVEEPSILEGIARRDVRFLQKPFSTDAFFGVIDEALGPA